MILASIIDADESKDVVIADLPNFFVYNEIGDECVLISIRLFFLRISMKIAPDSCKKNSIMQKRQKLLHMHLLNSLNT